MQEVSTDWGAIERPGPGAGQAHGVVRVHVGQEEEPSRAGPPQAPEVHRDGRVRDQDPVHGGNGFAGLLVQCSDISPMAQ